MPVQFVNGGYIVWQDNDTPQWLMLCERSLSTDLYSLQKIIYFLLCMELILHYLCLCNVLKRKWWIKMNLWMNRIINFLFILSLMPISVYSQYSVRGIVIDDNGSHVNGAQISLYQNGELEALTRSNVDGEYSIDKVSQGK